MRSEGSLSLDFGVSLDQCGNRGDLMDSALGSERSGFET